MPSSVHRLGALLGVAAAARPERKPGRGASASCEVHGIARFAVTPCNGFPAVWLMGGHTGMDPFAPAFFSLLPKFKVADSCVRA